MEEHCRSILEQLYPGLKFATCRPDFLKNPLTGENLELDCFNEQVLIALEYQGIQHYRYPNPFHKSEEEFRKLIIKDEYKKQVCQQIGIILITVPFSIPKPDIEKFITYRLLELTDPENLEN